MEAGTVSMPSDDPLSAQTAEKAAPHHMAADSSTLIGNGSSDVGCEHDALAAQPQRPSQDPGGPMQRSAAASTSSRREGLSAPDVGSLGDGAAGSAGGTEARSSGGEGTKQGEGAGAGGTYEARIRRFRGDLGSARVDLSNLRRMAVHGIPDRDGLRAVAWKLLLGYLPSETAQWPAVLAQKRAAYAQFCAELIVDPKSGGGGAGRECGGGAAAPAADHPLSQSTNSKWHAFFKDAEMMEQIDRDVLRTHPDMHFFSGGDGSAVQHRAEMKRCLFVFAKLNPGLRYVQGMNELLAPLYYHFRTDPAPGVAEHAEADAFYCFMDLLAEFRDHFCQQLDNSKVGIRATLSKLSDLLEQKDPELWTHLQVKNKVNPQFYAFRWITLLLTQEFPFPDSVRLWDSLFSDRAGRYDSLLRFCCAMLVNVREDLLKGDFAQNLKMLQKYPPVDVHAILHRATCL